MWKKDELTGDMPMTEAEKPAPRQASAQPAPEGADRATIGRSIVFRGDLTGEEDLMIQGRVEGSVDLGQHALTVGPDGEVIASIVGRVVTVEGHVEGNIEGAEQVTLRTSSFVKGDITAPRVVLENGARFRGLVDMGEGDDPNLWASTASNSRGGKAPTNGKPIKEAMAAAPKLVEASRPTPETPSDSKEATGATPDKGKKPNDVVSPIML